MKGRSIHEEVRKTNTKYLRKKLGVIDKKADVYLASKTGIRGVVDEILFFNDGSAAPLDYKYAEYKNKIYRTHRYQLVFYAKLIQENFNVEVNKGYVVYTRSKNKLVEIELKKADFNKFENMVREIVAIIYKCHYPAPTIYKKSCLDCCYKNICDSVA
jgi:CRISPR-associated exonuclease Cas4